jgi:sec-independent protein translocase protein TatB
MLDIGFTELIVIAAIALFVVGPERLPSTIRSIWLWIGRLKRSLNEIKDEVGRELHNEEVMRALADSKEQIKDITDVSSLVEAETMKALEEPDDQSQSSKRE